MKTKTFIIFSFMITGALIFVTPVSAAAAIRYYRSWKYCFYWRTGA